jgi:hypothetical protein
MATIAVFIALGGTAVAAGFVISKNSQLGPGTVSGSNPPAGKHNNVIGSSITGKDIKPNSVGGQRVIESSLGTVPSAANAGNANNLGGQPAANFLTINQSAGGDLFGGFSNLQLAQNAAGTNEIADVQRSIPIPLASLIDCQTDGGAFLTFNGSADSADNKAAFNVPNTDGSSPLVHFDADPTLPDQNFEVCSALTLPPDYASGGAFHLRGVHGSPGTAEEDLQCAALVNSSAPDTGSVVIDISNVNKSCTPPYSVTPAPGDDIQFSLSITSPTTMDSLVDFYSLDFVYNAVQ